MCTVRIDIPCPGTLAPIASDEALVRLDVDQEHVRAQPLDRRLLERRVRRPLELDRDRRLAPRRAACPSARRTACRPSASCRRRASRRRTSRSSSRARRPPPRGSRAPRRPRRSRARTGPRTTDFGPGRVQRAQHLDLLVADRVGGEVARRLHRGEREQLQQVVLEDVADRAGLLVEAGRGPRSPIVSATVICTWSMNWRFQIGSKMPLAKRNASRFCTVSLPR